MYTYRKPRLLLICFCPMDNSYKYYYIQIMATAIIVEDDYISCAWCLLEIIVQFHFSGVARNKE